MARKVYVGNMSYDTTESKLQELFAAHGEVASVSVVTDRHTGRLATLPSSRWQRMGQHRQLSLH